MTSFSTFCKDRNMIIEEYEALECLLEQWAQIILKKALQLHPAGTGMYYDTGELEIDCEYELYPYIIQHLKKLHGLSFEFATIDEEYCYRIC